MLKAEISVKGSADLAKKIIKFKQEVERQEGKHDVSTSNFVPGPILHQGTDEMTEEESAQREVDNPELVAFLESLKHKLSEMLK